jgi:uncharacterized surface protein with fasciclin (FAS1) repeats
MAARLMLAVLVLLAVTSASADGEIIDHSRHHVELLSKTHEELLKQLLPPTQTAPPVLSAPATVKPASPESATSVTVPPPPVTKAAVAATSTTMPPPPVAATMPAPVPVRSPSPPVASSAVSATSTTLPPPVQRPMVTPSPVMRTPVVSPVMPTAVKPPTAPVAKSAVSATSTNRCIKRNSTVTRPAEPCTRTVAQELDRVPELSTLLRAVRAAGLEGAFNVSNSELTVFAPTNNAFDCFVTSRNITLAKLLADTATLATVLKYHVIPRTALLSCQVTASQTLTTLQGETLVVGVKLPQETLVITGMRSNATAVKQDVRACRSVVHLVDHVLLP